VRPRPEASFATAPSVRAAVPDAPAARPPALIPSKAPIRFEEGLVEVGWEGDLESEFDDSVESIATNNETPAGVASGVQETVVEDHYAALQAWTEQVTNRRRAESEQSASGDQVPQTADDQTELSPSSTGHDPAGEETRQPSTPAKIRAEAQHDFAPYSQLFSRLRQSS
jgi:general secretion pathway protein A